MYTFRKEKLQILIEMATFAKQNKRIITYLSTFEKINNLKTFSVSIQREQYKTLGHIMGKHYLCKEKKLKNVRNKAFKNLKNVKF